MTKLEEFLDSIALVPDAHGGHMKKALEGFVKLVRERTTKSPFSGESHPPDLEEAFEEVVKELGLEES